MHSCCCRYSWGETLFLFRTLLYFSVCMHTEFLYKCTNQQTHKQIFLDLSYTCSQTLKNLEYEPDRTLSLRCSYLWPWSPRGPRPAAGLRGHCTATVHQPRQWWTPMTRGSRNKALWEETRHNHCHGNCACSAGTRAPQTEPGIGTLGRRGNQEPKWHKLRKSQR